MSNCILVTDRRTFKDRRELWAADKKQNEFVAERPKAKIKQVVSEETPTRKPKRAPAREKSEETHEELVSQLVDENCLLIIGFFSASSSAC